MEGVANAVVRWKFLRCTILFVQEAARLKVVNKVHGALESGATKSDQNLLMPMLISDILLPR